MSRRTQSTPIPHATKHRSVALTLAIIFTAVAVMTFWPDLGLVSVAALTISTLLWLTTALRLWHKSPGMAPAQGCFIEHDPLTGLLSRSAITTLLRTRLEDGDTGPQPLGLLFLDFDRFKMVNDAMGHEAGDVLLRQIGEQLAAAVREGPDEPGVDYHLGRLGGDEFVVLVEGTTDTSVIGDLAELLHTALTRTYDVAGRTVHSSVSIGVTTTLHGCATADDMLRDADTAMYAAKQAGRARTAWFDKSMHDAVRDAIELENDLRHAVVRDELFLVYQPIIDLEGGHVTGFEALIRWRHPERGLVRPDQFIAIAEDSQLIRPIGRWVLRQALEQIKVWRQRFPELEHAVMNVNLSRVQFADPGLTEYVMDSLKALELPNAALCLEITESTIMEDDEAAITLLQHFRDLGIKLAMDDFGTGYSSLSHLHEFPLDALKIDKAFIDNLSNNRDYAAVIQAITALAGNLGFTVVAEGVESLDQIAELQALACHKGQGYFFHKPAEPEVIEAYLSEREVQSRNEDGRSLVDGPRIRS